MLDQLGFPATASTLWVFATVAVSYLVSDILLGRILRLSRRAWKKTDYVWLGLAVIGVLGLSASLRRQLAPGLSELQLAITNSWYGDVRSSARFLTGSAVCRQFDPGILTGTALDSLNREYGAVCSYGRRLAASLPETLTVGVGVADIVSRDRPVVRDVVLLDQFRSLEMQVTAFESAYEAWRSADRARDQTDFELTLAVVSPFLLGCGLGLRLARVTAELRLEA